MTVQGLAGSAKIRLMRQILEHIIVMTARRNRPVKARATGLLAGVLLTMLAGCTAPAGSGWVIYNHRLDAYNPEARNYAASRGGMLLELPNNPFAASDQELGAVIADMLYGAPSGQDFPFFTEAEKPDGYASPYRLVVLLDATPGAKSEIVCREPSQPVATDPLQMRVLMALCIGDRLMSTASGAVARPDRPRSLPLSNLLRRMAYVIMPHYDPNQDDSRRANWLD